MVIKTITQGTCITVYNVLYMSSSSLGVSIKNTIRLNHIPCIPHNMISSIWTQSPRITRRRDQEQRNISVISIYGELSILEQGISFIGCSRYRFPAEWYKLATFLVRNHNTIILEHDNIRTATTSGSASFPSNGSHIAFDAYHRKYITDGRSLFVCACNSIVTKNHLVHEQAETTHRPNHRIVMVVGLYIRTKFRNIIACRGASYVCAVQSTQDNVVIQATW